MAFASVHPLMFFVIYLGAKQTGNYPYSLVLFKIGLLINFGYHGPRWRTMW